MNPTVVQSTNDAFLAHLSAHADDEAARMIYADWLDDQGDADSLVRAEFLRLSHALDDPATKSGFGKLWKRREHLRERIDIPWQIQASAPPAGTRFYGTVERLTEATASLDMGTAKGILHMTDLPWGRIVPLSELFSVGQRLPVALIAVSPEGVLHVGWDRRTTLIWDVIDDYPIGSRLLCEVVGVMTYGAFVKLALGVEGLLHVDELRRLRPFTHPNERLSPGDRIEVVIKGIKPRLWEIALALPTG